MATRTKTTKTTTSERRPLTRYAGAVPDPAILAAVPGWFGLGARVRLLPADLRVKALALAAEAVAKVEQLAAERARADAGQLKVIAPLLLVGSILLGCAGPVSLPSGRGPEAPSAAQTARLDAFALPATIGDADAPIVAAVAIATRLREPDGSVREMLPERIVGVPFALRDAAARIADYSDGRLRLRFELRVIDEIVESESLGDGARWVDADSLRAPIEAAFPGGADLVVVFAEPYLIDERPIDAGYTSGRDFFGADRPYISLSSPYIAIWGGVIPPLAEPIRPGDLFIHEFGHALEVWSDAAGIDAPRMHDAGKHGHLPSEHRTDYSDWYREFFAAQELLR